MDLRDFRRNPAMELPKGVKTITAESHPHLWNGNPEHRAFVDAEIKRHRLTKYLFAKRAYYQPLNPEVISLDVLTDAEFDRLEIVIRNCYPDHPLANQDNNSLVGWSDDYLVFLLE